MSKPENLKQGEYYGYHDEKGNWITGQNGPNIPSPAAKEKIDQWFHDYGVIFSRNWFRAVGKDILFAVGLSNK